MIDMSPQNISFYKKRADGFLLRSQKYNRRARTISILRIITFVSFLVITIGAANQGNLPLLILSLIFFILIFGLLVNLHERIRRTARQYDFLLRINEEEILRLEGRIDSFDKGSFFTQTDHSYHVDLDIFGDNSLFQLLNRTTTYWGRKTLAKWLSVPARVTEIHARQSSVQELSRDIDWSQEFHATGKHYEYHKDLKAFLSWLEEEPLILYNRFYQIIRYAGPVIVLSLLMMLIFSTIPWIWFLSGIFLQALVILSVLDHVKSIHQHTMESIKSLQSLEALIRMVEKKDFRSDKLRGIGSIFRLKGIPASKIIGKLKRILLGLDNRSNQIYQLFNLILLLDLHYATAAEKWKTGQPDDIKNWFAALGEIEALNSLAGFQFANPSYSFPGISTDGFFFQAENMGHPLIPYGKRVLNDFALKGKGTIAMITGSNMAGKSTFLRTVGINTVLALMGSPVCAGKLTLSNLRIFTSMRTQDNLEENISTFYAELKRVRQLFDQINQLEPLLFLLDEILKGTNSRDRHLGAVSLVNQLAAENVTGLISTHDLDLARITMKASPVVNYSFESLISGDEIRFDYKLRPGICETFNASKLMEKMGIRLINPDQIEKTG
jgi:hypothetical protein